jgi:membrane-bound serine protease (ClpP class)
MVPKAACQVLSALVCGAAACAPSPAPFAADDAEPHILRASLHGPVNPGSSSYLGDAVHFAEAHAYTALLVYLDTPGGMVDSTREIASAFLSAKIPVIVYVAPAGAHAGSAGVFITLAANIAAMAPATNIGAAHPVTGSGEDIAKDAGSTMAKKVENDLAAFARSLAEQRGRNIGWAEKAVRESAAITASEALKNHVIDLMADSESALLTAIDGRTVKVGNSRTIVHTLHARVDVFPMTIQQRALAVLGDPNVAYVLVMIGLFGLMMELYHPGTIIPGVVGAFCFLLAGIGFNFLPVRIGALVLLVAAVAFFVAELYVSSFGVLALAGIVSLVLGSLLLMNRSNPSYFVDRSFEVSMGLIIPSIVLIVAITMTILVLVVRAQRRRGTAGSEGLVGEIGFVQSEVGAEAGAVLVHGESWQARSAEPLAVGTQVQVKTVNGLCIEVQRHHS